MYYDNLLFIAYPYCPMFRQRFCCSKLSGLDVFYLVICTRIQVFMIMAFINHHVVLFIC
jgi:hypothetical protein